MLRFHPPDDLHSKNSSFLAIFRSNNHMISSATSGKTNEACGYLYSLPEIFRRVDVVVVTFIR